MRANAPQGRSTVRAVAQAGNAVALFAILLTLTNSTLLFSTTVPPAPANFGTTSPPRVLFIVIDGLRADAVNPDQMPNVYALAQRGAYRKSHVDALIPSTIAGLRALIEGVVVPPAEFVNDFRSRRASKGGLIESVANSGRRVFAAGPHLWRDLYGQWLTGSVSVFGLARDDPTVLRATRAACADSRWTLVVAQFCRPDVMAHMHGALSQEYSSSIRWCDRAIGELVRNARDNTLVVVTSDHGVTRMGGHAGAEAEVLETPLVLSQSTVAPNLPEQIRQTHVPYLLATVLGTRLPKALGNSTSSSRGYPAPLSLAAALLGGLATLALLATATDYPPEAGAFWLNTSVWVTLGIAWLNPWGACIVTAATLLAFAWRFGALPSGVLAGSFMSGIVLGALRVGVPWFTAGASATTHPSWLLIGSVCAAACVIGYGAARFAGSASATGLIRLGAGIVVIAPAMSGLLGESVSLSTLDVRLAFRAIESPAGLLGAVLVASVQPFLPLLFLLVGVTWARCGVSHGRVAALSNGAGAVIAGELAFAATLLAYATSKPLSALALGLLLRECALVLVLFPVLAVVAFCLQRAKPCHEISKP